MRKNVVVVTTTGEQAPLQAYLDGRYGAAVAQAERTTAPPHPTYTRGSAPPAYGGQQISSVVPNGFFSEWECTDAFTARQNSTGRDMVLTAGHCPLANGNNPWYVGYGSATCFFPICSQYSLGTAYNGAFGGNYDGADFYLHTNSDARNWVYTSSSSVVTIVGVGAYGDLLSDVVGATVCQSDGHANMYVCGQVQATDATVTYQAENVTLYHCRIAATYSEGGDSGAPVVGPTNDSALKTAVGIVSGGNGTSTVYTHVRRYVDDFGLTIPA